MPLIIKCQNSYSKIQILPGAGCDSDSDYDYDYDYENDSDCESLAMALRMCPAACQVAPQTLLLAAAAARSPTPGSRQGVDAGCCYCHSDCYYCPGEASQKV